MENEDVLKEAVYSPFVLEFLAVAQKYCLFIEEINKYNQPEILDYLHKALSLLYVRGSVLPAIETDDLSANEKYVTVEHWETVFNEIREKFQESDIYWFIENDNPNNDVVKGSLADNLTDIYQDMKDFVLLYQKPFRDAKKAAAWEIRELYRSHWGFRAVNALKVIHYQIFGEANTRGMDNVLEEL